MKEPIIISSQGKSYAKIEDIVITEQEKVTVNGMETNRFVGYFDCPSSDGSVNDRYIVGYILKKRTRISSRTVTDNEQDQKHIKKLQTVDDMIKTLKMLKWGINMRLKEQGVQ